MAVHERHPECEAVPCPRPISADYFDTGSWGTVDGEAMQHGGFDYGGLGLVFSVTDGEVVRTGFDRRFYTQSTETERKGFGHYVVVRIDEGNGFHGQELLYAHVLPVVAKGDWVRRGALIANVDPDSTKNSSSTAPHVHMQLQRHYNPVHVSHSDELSTYTGMEVAPDVRGLENPLSLVRFANHLLRSTVRQGDTLAQVSARFDAPVDWWEILAANAAVLREWFTSIMLSRGDPIPSHHLSELFDLVRQTPLPFDDKPDHRITLSIPLYRHTAWELRDESLLSGPTEKPDAVDKIRRQLTLAGFYVPRIADTSRLAPTTATGTVPLDSDFYIRLLTAGANAVEGLFETLQRHVSADEVTWWLTARADPVVREATLRRLHGSPAMFGTLGAVQGAPTTFGVAPTVIPSGASGTGSTPIQPPPRPQVESDSDFYVKLLTVDTSALWLLLEELQRRVPPDEVTRWLTVRADPAMRDATITALRGASTEAHVSTPVYVGGGGVDNAGSFTISEAMPAVAQLAAIPLGAQITTSTGQVYTNYGLPGGMFSATSPDQYALIPDWVKIGGLVIPPSVDIAQGVGSEFVLAGMAQLVADGRLVLSVEEAAWSELDY